jgi:hypothetical protein
VAATGEDVVAVLILEDLSILGAQAAEEVGAPLEGGAFQAILAIQCFYS